MIALCMIIRTYSRKLEYILDLLYNYFSEIIIVFTKKNHFFINKKIKSYFYPFSEDFSEVRNFSIRKATSQWIFVIDDDEYINPDDVITLNSLIHQHEADAFLFLRYDYITYPGWDIKIICRLFKNSNEIYYTGKVYEEVIDSLCKNNKKYIVLWNAPHFHHIIEHPYQKLQEKYQLYRKILFKSMNSQSTDMKKKEIFLWHIAMLWADSNDFNQALYYIRQITNSYSSYYKLVQLSKAGILFAIGHYFQALKILNTLYFPQADRYFQYRVLNLSGIICSYIGKYENALRYYNEALKTEIPPSAIYSNIGIAYLEVNKINKAQEYFKKAFLVNPYISQLKTGENDRIWKHRLHTDVRLKAKYFKTIF